MVSGEFGRDAVQPAFSLGDVCSRFGPIQNTGLPLFHSLQVRGEQFAPLLGRRSKSLRIVHVPQALLNDLQSGFIDHRAT